MQIYKPEFFTPEQAEALKNYYENIIIGKPFGSEHYSKIGKIEIVPFNNKCMIKIWANDKLYYMSLTSCAKSLGIILPNDYLKEQNLV